MASDKLGYDQAVTATELPLVTWKAYIDGVSVGILQNATCTLVTAGNYTCKGDWPAATPGTHKIELAAIRTEGTLVLEGPKSLPFDFKFVVATAAPTNLRNIHQ